MFSLKREIRHNTSDFTFHNFLAGKCNDLSCGLPQKCTIVYHVSVFFFFSQIRKFTGLEFLDKHERTTSANVYLNLRVLYFSYPICGALNTWLWFQNARRYEDQQWTIQQEILHCEEKPPEPSIQKGSISFSSKLDKTSQTIICAIQYSEREDFFQTRGGKKSYLSDLCSHTMAVVEVAPPLIFSQLDSCRPPCLLWSSHSHPRSFCQPASCQSIHGIKRHPMLSYDQRHTGKKTQSHIQLPSQRMSHFPPFPHNYSATVPGSGTLRSE